MKKAIYVTALFLCLGQNASSEPILTPQQEQLAAEGRRQTDNLKQAFRQNKISLLQYFQKFYEIDRDYFSAPPPVIELDLYNIMMARNVELGKITREEFDYFQHKKIEETAKKMTTFE